MENSIFLSPAVAGLMSKGFVEARHHTDIQNTLTAEQFDKNRALQAEGLSFDPPAESRVRPGTVLGDVAIPPLPDSWFRETIDPYDFVYAEVPRDPEPVRRAPAPFPFMPVCLQYDVPSTPAEYRASQLYYVYKHTKCILSGVQGLAMIVSVAENGDDGAGLSLEELKSKKIGTNGFREVTAVAPESVKTGLQNKAFRKIKRMLPSKLVKSGSVDCCRPKGLSIITAGTPGRIGHFAVLPGY